MTSASTYSSKSSGQPHSDPFEIKADKTQPALNTLPERQPPLSDNCWLHGKQPVSDEVWVIMSPSALQQIADHAYSDTGHELGGALLGHAFRYQQTIFVEVKAAIPALNRDHGPIHFTFTADSWSQLQKDRDGHYPQLDIVGWFHTHPGLGVFYSSDDVVVHSAAFTQPWHVGLVFDPLRNEAAFFGWVKEELAPLSGFYELLHESTQPIIDWRVVRTSVWSHGYDEDQENNLSGTTPHGQYTTAVSPAFTPLQTITLSIGLTALLLSLLLFTLWFQQNQQVDYLQHVVLTLSDEAVTNSDAICPDPNMRILSPLAGQEIIAGPQVDILGTTMHPEAHRYRVHVRASNSGEWQLIDRKRRSTAFGQVAVWDTSQFEPASYQLRLTAIDRNELLLAHINTCIVTVQLLPNNNIQEETEGNT